MEAQHGAEVLVPLPWIHNFGGFGFLIHDNWFKVDGKEKGGRL
jgi:hypothetical protein